MYRISKKFRFEAAHSLPHLPEGHKCQRQHGHSYQVEVVLEADDLDESGFVVDYAELDSFRGWINSNLDHQDLNQVLSGELPTTAENIAATLVKPLWDCLPTLHGVGLGKPARVRIACIVVKETESTSAEWIPWGAR